MMSPQKKSDRPAINWWKILFLAALVLIVLVWLWPTMRTVGQRRVEIEQHQNVTVTVTQTTIAPDLVIPSTTTRKTTIVVSEPPPVIPPSPGIQAITLSVEESGSNWAYLPGEIIAPPNVMWSRTFEIRGPSGSPNIIEGQGIWKGDSLLENLARGIYNYRLVVVHEFGTSYGNWKRFTIP